eukprot:12072701-Alexandrium_andersonii.AAC.1
MRPLAWPCQFGPSVRSRGFPNPKASPGGFPLGGGGTSVGAGSGRPVWTGFRRPKRSNQPSATEYMEGAVDSVGPS